MKLNGMIQLLVQDDDANILGGKKHAIKKGTNVLVVASKPTGIEQNTWEITYMVMSRDQNARKTQT